VQVSIKRLSVVIMPNNHNIPISSATGRNQNLSGLACHYGSPAVCSDVDASVETPTAHPKWTGNGSRDRPDQIHKRNNGFPRTRIPGTTEVLIARFAGLCAFTLGHGQLTRHLKVNVPLGISVYVIPWKLGISKGLSVFSGIKTKETCVSLLLPS
jgi:hypothetical protein